MTVFVQDTAVEASYSFHNIFLLDLANYNRHGVAPAHLVKLLFGYLGSRIDRILGARLVPQSECINQSNFCSFFLARRESWWPGPLLKESTNLLDNCE